jgi:hypothetical protein
MIMVFRGGGLARRRPLLRAAVVGGGAYMAGRSAAQRSAEASEREAAQEARLSDLEQSQPQVPAPRASQAAGSSMMDQLSQLARMHAEGALTDEEFAAAKARLLG